jgi:PAS domain S-box-containing protein
VEASPLSTCRKDLEGRFTFANRRFLEVSHITLDELIGKTDFDLHPFELAQKYRSDDLAIMEGGEARELIEERAVHNGERAITQTIKAPLYDGEGKLNGIQISFWDITDRIRAENELQALFAAMTDVIIVYNSEGRYLKIAPTNQSNLYLPPADMIGKTVSELFPPQQAEFFLEKIQHCLNTAKLTSAEYRLNIEGRDIWFSALISRMSEDTVIWVARDITDYKRNERELARETKYFETLLTNSPVAIVVMDNDGRILLVNPAFESLFGYTSEEAVGVILDDLVATPETQVEAARYSQDIMTGSIHGIVRRRRKDGTLVDVELSGVPIIVAGRKLSALVLYHDITELVKARREAEAANRAKSQFLANMSHEIRTPMNGVIGMLELALDTKLNPEQIDYLQTSLRSAEALLTLLNVILDFSKIEAGRLELEAINFNLRNAVEDVAYTLANRAQDKGLEMACLIDPDLVATLRGDPGRLRQILVNLVGNAIKFTHQGEIVIRAEPREETDNHVVVHFSVQDTGIGIPYDRQAAVFERFTQADGTTTRTYGGTGLGLTISKQLVEMMGGTIGLTSVPGVGATFWFDIRFEKVKPAKTGVTGPLTPGPSNLTQARILVVDDNQTNRIVLVKNVEALGSRVDAVPSGAKAIESLRNAQRAGDPYHVVLLDMQMPGMDGEQTARSIKSDPSIKDVKILILTSMGQRGDASRLSALGCAGYLLKPIKQQVLFDAVLAVLGQTDDAPANLITRHSLSENKPAGARLLLAEDNPVNQKLAVIILQKAGYLVDAVESGVEAVKKIQSYQYSLVLMDVQMPEMDGYEATRQIRAWEAQKGRHTPIVAMTAYAMSGDRELCIAAGMDDYVSKPLEPRVLFNVIDRWAQNLDSPKNEEPVIESLGRDWLGESLMPVPESTPEPDPVSPFSPQPDDAPLADLEASLFRFSNDRDFMKEMAAEFRDHLPARIDEFDAALQAGNIQDLGRLAHNLKGVCLNFNARRLADASAQLELCGKREDLSDAPALVELVKTEIKRLKEYLDLQLK